MEQSGPHAQNEFSTALSQSEVSGWDSERVMKWLEQEKLNPYIPLFQDLAISGPTLLDLNDRTYLNSTFPHLNDDERDKLSVKINDLINEKGNQSDLKPNE